MIVASWYFIMKYESRIMSRYLKIINEDEIIIHYKSIPKFSNKILLRNYITKLKKFLAYILELYSTTA